MAAPTQDSDFQRLPIQPEDGFPQAFVLNFEGRLYRFTFSISFLTLEPFKVWEAGDVASDELALRTSQHAPISVLGDRAPAIEGSPEGTVYVLPQEELYLVMKVERDDLPEGERLLGLTRPVLDTTLRLGDLVFLFKKIHVARGNLLGPGSFGSEIVVGVATYGG